MTKQWMRRTVLLALALLLMLQPLSVLAENTDEIQFYAFATVALKLRRAPEKSSGSFGSIPKGATVYITQMTNDEWAQVTTETGVGYVQTKYLENVTEYDAEKMRKAEEDKAFKADVSVFREAYQAYAVKDAAIREKPDENSRWIGTANMLDEVIVSVVDGDWCYARYKNRTFGYIKCDDLFKWDRLLADAGEIPNLDILPLMIYVNKSTNIYDAKDNSILKTINPGTAVSAFEKDGMGRYSVPYYRTYGYINEEDVACEVPVQDYETAEYGDLIAVMSTFYAVGVTTLQYQGRNWNIHLASSMINGYTLQPGEEYNQYKVIGPYRKSTGYHPAPIMRKGALWGYGGGTCQVNTTFYITNIQLPILVTHRRVHADVGTYYAKKGLDAAVGGGDINLILTNTMPYAIRYQFYDSDGVLTCCIYKAS